MQPEADADQPDTTVAAQQVWVVRAGRGAAYAEQFRAAGVVSIGFGFTDSVEGLSWDDLTARMRKEMPDDPAVTVGLAVGALFRLANEFRVGDFVVTPEAGGTLLIGEVTGSYEFRESPIGEDHHHVRPVRWFARIPRSILSESARRSLGSMQTLFLPSQQELLEVIRPLISGSTPGPAPTKATKTSSQPAASTTSAEIPDDPVDPPGPTGSKFETDKRDLLYLLDQIHNRDLALPDFQRSFVWDAMATRELIVSIVRSFPAGNLLFLRGGSEVFLPRAAEEAPALDGHTPNALVLDGQQRLSSLYQAFGGVGSHRFFVDIPALMAGDDIDAAIRAYSVSRAKPWATIQGQARSLMLPLGRVRDYSYWRDEVLDHRDDLDPEARKRLRSYLNAVETSIIAPIRAYQFPLTTLSEETSAEAVCTIFETLNRTGIKLSVFELICARAFAEGHRLRERWHESLDQHPILVEFGIDPYYLLQAIALRVGKKPQRGVVAALQVSTIVEEWDAAARGMASALIMLRDECGVLTPKWLPYAPMLPTMAAAWRDVDDAHGPAAGARRLKLQQWFWASSFEGDYDNAPNSRAEADIPLLHTWLTGGDPPPVVAGFSFDPANWLNVTVRQRGLYRATMALLMRNRPLDFHQAVPLTRSVIETNAVDDHHVFPAAYLRDIGQTKHVDTVLNHTLIDKITNIRIGKKAPSVYLAEMAGELGTTLTAVLDSHGLPAEADGPLWENDYDSFLERRLSYLAEQLSSVAGSPNS
jgi:hypothetical protein